MKRRIAILCFCMGLFLPMLALASGFRISGTYEATIADIHAAMKAGKLTAQELVQMYLDRIEAYDKQGPFINSLITINPKAIETAANLDAKFAASGFVGPLHGIPVIVKDNFDTYDLPTTNGTLGLKDSVPPDDAYIVRKLREAGAIILAKSNLAEFASSGVFTVSSVLPGYTRNPYDTRRVTAGSSGGTAAAIAANFATVGLGSDTGSSIRGPSAHQSLVGIRPTMGLTSRDGIIPLDSTRDVGGPMARTVADAVAVLGVIAGYDPADPVTAESQGKVPQNYSQFLDPGGLKGARIGALRQLFEPAGTDPEVLKLSNQALEDMRKAGATIIDLLPIPELEEIRGAIERASRLKYRLKYDFERYLASLGPSAPFRTLKGIVESEKYHPFLEGSLDRALAVPPPEENPDYRQNQRVYGRFRKVILKAMEENGVDAIFYPTFRYPPVLIGDRNSPAGTNSQIFAPTGFPAFAIPMGFTYGDLPAGFQFLGRPFSEPTLIRLSYAYEQATQHRRPPKSTPPLDW